MSFTEEQTNYFRYIQETIIPLYKAKGNDKIITPTTNLEWNLKKLLGQIAGETLDVQSYVQRTKYDFTAIYEGLKEGEEGRDFAKDVLEKIDGFFGIPPLEKADLKVILGEKLAKAGEKLDWQRSVVDLLKLLGRDSSFAARKKYAVALGFPEEKISQVPSAEFNIWLHGALLNAIAYNSGEVPVYIA